MSEYKKYLRELKAVCLAKGFVYKSFRLKNGLDFPIVEIHPETYSKTLLIIVGLHGNEQSPVYAVKEFLSEYTDEETRLLIFPCMNPSGFEANTRKNNNEADLNRIKGNKPLEEEQTLLFQQLFNIRFDGALSMHEDNATIKTYFYAYNRENDSIYRNIQEGAGKYMKLNKNDRIDGNLADQGIIYDKPDSSLESFLYSKGVPLVLCSETGGREELGVRVKCNSFIISRFIDG